MMDRRHGDMVFIVTLILVCGLSVFIGVASPLGSFAHDTFFLLDGAYRVTQGQIPHRDFSSAWGPLIFLIEAGGLWLSGMKPAALGYASAACGALLGVWFYLMARSKWSTAAACAAGIYTLLLVAAPFPIGIHPFDYGYAMVYNRIGFALFGIIMIECAVDAQTTQPGRWRRWVGAVSSGMVIGLLLFLKVSYALIAGPYVAILLLFGHGGRTSRIAGLLSGCAIVGLVMLWYLQFDMSDMFRDLAMAAASRQSSLNMLHPIGQIDALQAALLAAAAVGLLLGKEIAGARRARWHGAAFAVLTVVVGYLLLCSNQQLSVFPLNFYAAIALISGYETRLTGPLLKWPMFSTNFPRVLLLASCLLPFSITNAAGIVGAAVTRAKGTVDGSVKMEFPESGASFVLRQFHDEEESETFGRAYVAAIEDGANLLRRHLHAGEGTLTFDEFNPFNYLLARPSPTGGFAAAAHDYVFSDAAHPDATFFFGKTAFVMVRKYKSKGPDVMERKSVAALMRLYGKELCRDFFMVEETEHWSLWHRAAPTRQVSLQACSG